MVAASPKAQDIVRLALVAVCVLTFSVRVPAQTLYGTLVGNVTDETGLAVPGATVIITHAETNLTREGTTNATGGYSFPNVPTGTYQVDVSLTGFQTASSRGIVVRQNKIGRASCRERVYITEVAEAGEGRGK